MSVCVCVSAVKSDEGRELVTAEDHGRGGSHHGEERRVLGALVRRHSCTSLGRGDDHKKATTMFDWQKIPSVPGPQPTSCIVTGRERRRAEEEGGVGCCHQSEEDRCSGGKWRNGKSHVTESISGASICVRAGVNAGVPVPSGNKTPQKVLLASLENLRGTTRVE